MPYVPKTAKNLLQGFAARVIAQTPLTDLAEGSILRILAESFAESLAGVEIRLKGIRDSYLFFDNPNLTGADLDERLGELPKGGVQRIDKSAASGAVLSVTRASAVTSLVIPAGSLVGRADDSSLLYRVAIDYTMGIGVTTLTGIQITALTLGATGNAPSGTVTAAVDMPSDIIVITNSGPLTNGLDAQTDAQARAMGANYLSSLPRTLPAAQKYAAESFVASDGTRVQFAAVWEDPSRPSYARLVVDDGTGMAGLVRAGAASSGTVPSGGQRIVWHESPATTEIDTISVARGANTVILSRADGDFVSIPERGLCYVASGKLVSGDVWNITGYSVFTGILAELQAEIEGNPSDPAKPGWRAGGCRAQVTPPTVQTAGVWYSSVPVTGADAATVSAAVKDAIIAYLGTLAPGEPLYVSSLYGALKPVAGMLKVRLWGDAVGTPLDDAYPAPDAVVRAFAASVNEV